MDFDNDHEELCDKTNKHFKESVGLGLNPKRTHYRKLTQSKPGQAPKKMTEAELDSGQI